MKKLVVVADWADDSLTCQEFSSAVEGFLQNPKELKISFVASTPSTLHTSYILSQIVQTEERYGRPQNTIIFQNTDPRIQTKEAVELARGADFIIVRLVSGIFVCGPNAGHDFSLLKEKIEKVYLYQNLDKGSQFRSRDLYSRVSAHLMEGLEDGMDLQEVPKSIIPDHKEFAIGHIDNYGNIKTTITKEDMKGKHEFGEEFTIKINNVKKVVKYVNNLFGDVPGKLVIAPGSSGRPDNPYLEIAVRIGEDYVSGKGQFSNPAPGSIIEFEK